MDDLAIRLIFTRYLNLKTVYYIVYVSASTRLLTENELRVILIENELKNRYKDISGLLLYSAGIFMQVLEGNRTNVEEAYQLIGDDIWHKDVIKLSEGNCWDRFFANWYMSFNTQHPQSFAAYKGYIEPALILLPNKTPNPGIELLKIFLEGSLLFNDVYKGVTISGVKSKFYRTFQ